MIFGVLNPEKIGHQQLIHVPTSPVYCSHFTLGNPKKSFSTVLFIHTSDYLRYLRRKQTVTTLPTTCPPHLKNVAALPCKMQNFFVWLKVISCSSKRLWLWKELVVGWHWWLWKEAVVMCGNWNVRQATSMCSKWPPSARIHASSLFCHWSTAYIVHHAGWNSAHVATENLLVVWCTFC